MREEGAVREEVCVKRGLAVQGGDAVECAWDGLHPSSPPWRCDDFRPFSIPVGAWGSSAEANEQTGLEVLESLGSEVASETLRRLMRPLLDSGRFGHRSTERRAR